MKLTLATIQRCLELIPLIRAKDGISLDELSRIADIPREQIVGELGSLMLMCGVPPYFPHDFLCFSIDDDRVSLRYADHFARPISLSALEGLALKMACEAVVGPAGERGEVIAQLLEKVEAAMSPEQRRQFGNLAHRVAVKEEAESVPKSLRARIGLAVSERRELLLDYATPGQPVRRGKRVAPYGVLTRDGAWYLVGHDHGHGRIVMLRLDRLRALDITEDTFEIPGDFRLDAWAERSFDAVEGEPERALVRFRGRSARWISESAEPGTVRPGSAPDEVLWQPAIFQPASLARFVLAFGAEAEVLAPADLRSQVRRQLEAVLAAHEVEAGAAEG